MSFVRMVYCEKIVCSGRDAGNGFRMRLLHGAQKAMKELYREVQFFRSSAAKKILHKRSAEAFLHTGFLSLAFFSYI